MASEKGLRRRWGKRRWPHFRPEEFGGPVHPELLDLLERLRAARGDRPLPIISGYRSPAHNAAVGGARLSQHLYGRAADIPHGYATPEQAAAAGARGIGVRDGYAVHVDVRTGPVARWNY